jgi:hypothetical protein
LPIRQLADSWRQSAHRWLPQFRSRRRTGWTVGGVENVSEHRQLLYERADTPWQSKARDGGHEFSLSVKRELGRDVFGSLVARIAASRRSIDRSDSAAGVMAGNAGAVAERLEGDTDPRPRLPPPIPQALRRSLAIRRRSQRGGHRAASTACQSGFLGSSAMSLSKSADEPTHPLASAH